MRDIYCKYSEIRVCAPKDSYCADSNINALNDKE